MTSRIPDRFRIPSAFWIGLRKIGLSPAVVLAQARLPATLAKDFANTAQFFALWRSVSELYPDPAAGLKFGSELDVAFLPPSSLAAYYASDYRDALARVARFKQLCSPEEMSVSDRGDECTIELKWPHAIEPAPRLLIDAAFASFVELGRRGTQTVLNPKRVEVMGPADATGAHAAFYKCPVKYRARRNVLALQRSDLDRPFVTHNPELLAMLDPQLAKALGAQQAEGSISMQAKWAMKRLLPGNRADIDTVARELRVGGRTLQRRITEEGSTFRQLLQEARLELARQYLAKPSTEIKEVAYLVGYEDPNSFYRAFQEWEGKTPSRWRSRALAQATRTVQ